jgi:hypothetical protein
MNSSRARQSDLLRQARAVLDLNWTGGFTKPALRQYLHQGHSTLNCGACRAGEAPPFQGGVPANPQRRYGPIRAPLQL